jgi:hypothetical protein
MALEELRLSSNAPEGQAPKLMADENQLSLMLAEPRPGDHVLRRHDEPLLIVDGEVAAALDGVAIDCEIAVVDGHAITEFSFVLPPSE